MITKREILEVINDLIAAEKGHPVTMDGMLSDAELDSLGVLMLMATLDAEFPILTATGEDMGKEDMELRNISIRDLVVKCKLSVMSDAKP